ncbi:hypothetical protein FAZ98_12750 [Paraburkholderia acidisoli]|jgi:predicted small lipoprotein YifL|uniref:Lipoprotein n=1 Tax=Paraburkholderia acidisoli TaxID=2571748 RepID=A0A7Z2JF93_9BURK|nr:hypothetical protein FAZ98_12750 [Paraburkholderia acidisoli]
MRVIFRMRAAARGVSSARLETSRETTRHASPRAILAAFAVGAIAVSALAGCGQRGPLYMPAVPPLPAKPNYETAPQPASGAEAASEPVGSVPDTTGTPLSLSPDSELNSVPASNGAAQPASQPATGATPNP